MNCQECGRQAEPHELINNYWGPGTILVYLCNHCDRRFILDTKGWQMPFNGALPWWTS